MAGRGVPVGESETISDLEHCISRTYDTVCSMADTPSDTGSIRLLLDYGVAARIRARFLFVLLALALLGACGCGSESPASRARSAAASSGDSRVSSALSTESTAGSTRRFKKPDHDGDADAHGSTAFFDSDDTPRDYGHAASEVDRRMIAAVVKRYYLAGAADNGAMACSLLDRRLANALSEEYGQALGRSSAVGNSCTGVVSKLFKGAFQWSRVDVAALKVADVRVQGNLGLVLINLHSEDHQILVEREGGAWRMGALFDSLVR